MEAAARSRSRSRHRWVSCSSVSPNSELQRPGQLGTAGDLLVEAHERLLRPRRRPAPGRPPTRSRTPPRGGSRSGRTRAAREVVRRAVAAHLLDDLAGRGADRQVDVVQGDVVGEPLEQPHRHPAGERGAGRDVRGLVAEHDLAAHRVQPVVDRRVDVDVHRRAGREGAVHRGRDRGDVGVGAGLGGQRGVEPLLRRRHLHHEPPGQRGSTSRTTGTAASARPATSSASPAVPASTSDRSERRTSTGPVSHRGVRRSPPPKDVIPTEPSSSPSKPTRTSSCTGSRSNPANRQVASTAACHRPSGSTAPTAST